MRIALDLLGGDHAPEAVIDGALLAQDRGTAQVLLVGPVELAERLLADRDATGRLEVVPANEVVTMSEDPARALRSKPEATVLIAARLVRDGRADAMVSVGPTGAALAAAVLTLGRCTNRPALAVVIPTPQGPLVLLDAGATSDSRPAHLVQHAVLGSAYAQALGIQNPRVGLLNVGEEPGKGDQLRKLAFVALSEADISFVGNVEGHDVALGGKAEVVVTDGFTGNVLLKGIEGATRRAGDTDLPVSGVLLGLDGLCVVGHGSSDAEQVAGCVAAAVQTHRAGLVGRIASLLGADRRTAVGS